MYVLWLDFNKKQTNKYTTLNSVLRDMLYPGNKNVLSLVNDYNNIAVTL